MLGGSVYYNADRLKRKEYTDLQKQKQEQDKRDAWIRELEARDAEDRAWRDKMGKVRDVKREEAEKAAVEEARRKRKGGGADDGKGVINAVKAKLKDAKEVEARRETAEQEQQQITLAAAARQRRLEMQEKQEAVKKMQFEVKEEAGYGRPKVWGEAGGGLFGWKRIRDFYLSRRRARESLGDSTSGDDNQGEKPKDK